MFLVNLAAKRKSIKLIYERICLTRFIKALDTVYLFNGTTTTLSERLNTANFTKARGKLIKRKFVKLTKFSANY